MPGVSLRWRLLGLAAAAVATFASGLAAQATEPPSLHWGAVPPILPPGAQIAVVSGDPTCPA
jgi:hypothetical protein